MWQNSQTFVRDMSLLESQSPAPQIRFKQKVLSKAQDYPNLQSWCLGVPNNHIRKSCHIKFFFTIFWDVPNGGLNPGPLDLKSTALPTTPWGRKQIGPNNHTFESLGRSIVQKLFTQGSKFKTNQHRKIRLQIFDIWCKNFRKIC